MSGAALGRGDAEATTDTADAADAGSRDRRCLRIVHLFPDLLSAYGDTGNVRALVVRAERRAIIVTVEHVLADAATVPAADVFVVGGGEDRDQLVVERTLARLGDQLVQRIDDGAALLAVCAGFQNLGRSYRLDSGRTVRGAGIFAATTEAGAERLVGPVVARLAPGLATVRDTVIGFENHAGRTEIDPGQAAFATLEIGRGNLGEGGREGILVAPDPARTGVAAGLRIGTYLHGPLLPRNPHVADALIRAGLARTGQPTDLVQLDDTEEWRAHDRFVAMTRRRSWVDRLPRRVGRLVAPARGLIGF